MWIQKRIDAIVCYRGKVILLDRTAARRVHFLVDCKEFGWVERERLWRQRDWRWSSELHR